MGRLHFIYTDEHKSSTGSTKRISGKSIPINFATQVSPVLLVGINKVGKRFDTAIEAKFYNGAAQLSKSQIFKAYLDFQGQEIFLGNSESLVTRITPLTSIALREAIKFHQNWQISASIGGILARINLNTERNDSPSAKYPFEINTKKIMPGLLAGVQLQRAFTINGTQRLIIRLGYEYAHFGSFSATDKIVISNVSEDVTETSYLNASSMNIQQITLGLIYQL